MSTTQSELGRISITADGYLSTESPSFNRRARELVDDRVEERFRNEVNAWAANNEGRLRTRLALRLEFVREVIAVCEALGPWAIVEPNSIFPTERRAQGRFDLFDWGDDGY